LYMFVFVSSNDEWFEENELNALTFFIL
jgi:hypothetical protein